MAYAVGHISGGHLRPTVSPDLVIGCHFPAKTFLSYWAAQVAGAIVTAVVV